MIAQLFIGTLVMSVTIVVEAAFVGLAIVVLTMCRGAGSRLKAGYQ